MSKDRYIDGKVLIFDLDGTILDTLKDLYEACNYALDAHGFPTRTMDEVRRFVGNGLARLVELAAPEGTDEVVRAQVLASLKEFYGIHCNDNTGPYPGIMDLLKELKKQGFRMAVVSNKINSAVGELCKLHFDGIFNFYMGEMDGIKRKPAPDMVWKALEHFGVSKEQAIYIGDSEVDLLTAANSELPCITVTWGFRDRELLLEKGASILVNSPEEILKL